jgi:uncharacterized protein (UPF0332 family)
MTDIKMISALMTKARSKLKTARLALDAGQYDDSVSRAYYAVFNAMTALLYKKKMVFSSFAHGQVIGAINREFIETGILSSDFAEQINGLFQDRQLSDYDPVSEITKAISQMHFNNAEGIINAIQALLDKDIEDFFIVRQ